MKYELWCGDLLLGRSELDFPQLSTITFAGEFEPAAGVDEQVERLAVASSCIRAWLDRDTLDSHGHHVVQPGFRNSPLFTATTEAIASRRNAALQLRRPDGTVVGARHLIIQDIGRLPEHAELVEDAIRASVEHSENEDLGPFDSPEGRELLRALDAEAEEESRVTLLDEQWRGDVHPDENRETDDWVFDPALIPPRARFNLHVMIERAGDIPADTSWLSD